MQKKEYSGLHTRETLTDLLGDALEILAFEMTGSNLFLTNRIKFVTYVPIYSNNGRKRTMPLVYTITSPIVSSFSSNLPVKVLELMPWVVSRESKVKESLQRMRDEGVHTLMVIDKNGAVLGLVTEDKEVALFGKKKKKTNGDRLDDCWEKCESRCAGKGGCAFADIKYDKKGRVQCTGHTCQDDITEAQTFETWF